VAKLAWIDMEGPVLIDPFRSDLDRRVAMPVEGQASVELFGEEARSFYKWVQNYWLDEFEHDLQSLSTHVVHGDLLTSGLPVDTFLEELCCRNERGADQSVDTLVDMLIDRTRAWREAGADAIYISGRDSGDRDQSKL